LGLFSFVHIYDTFIAYTILIKDREEVMNPNMQELQNKKAFICDMDGVIYHGNRIIPHVAEFVEWLLENDKKFLFLTNSAERSPRELEQKLSRMGLKVSEDHFYTSALATASFLASQCPGGSAYVIGEPGLTYALYEAGFSMNDVNPDYVVFGETRSLNYEKIEKAVKLTEEYKNAKIVLEKIIRVIQERQIECEKF
jgi:NagD protein